MDKIMRKQIIIKDLTSGEVETDITTARGYHLQVPEDNKLLQVGNITLGQYDHKHEIVNFKYAPIAEKLKAKFEELSHIDISRILFLEDFISFAGKPPREHTWVARVKKAPADVKNIWGYWHIITIRQHLVSDKSNEQIVALIYHELRHIGKFGDVIPHDIEDWSNIVETFGKDWFDGIYYKVDDILSDNFEWSGRGSRDRHNHNIQLSLSQTADHQEAAKLLNLR